MKIYIHFILILLISTIARADDFNFTPERMITDFHGVVYNGKNVLAYGDYGIITFSEDRGMNWQQLNIGDKYNIKKIRTIERDFFGVTEFSIIKSTTNGKSWINMEISSTQDIISCAVDDYSVYILTKNSVLRCNNNLDFDAVPLIEFDSKQKYTEIEYHNDYIYLLSDNDTLEQKHILKINPESGNIERISLTIVLHRPSDIAKFSNLQFHGNNIYYINEIIKTVIQGGKSAYYMMKSEDKGQSWRKFYYGYCIANFIDDDKIYNLRERNSQFALSEIIASQFPDSLALETVITDTSSPPERYQTLTYTTITDVIRLSKDTLVTVGKSKTIAVTVDEGKKWILKSRYRHQLYLDIKYYSGNSPPVFINNKTIFNSNRYRTFDGGITWLPPLHSENKNINDLYSDLYYFDKDGTGMTISNGGISLQMLKTEDFGENYELENTSIIDSSRICNIVSDQNSNLFSLLLYKPIDNSETDYTYKLIKSSDTGNSWEMKISNLPIPSKVVDNEGKPYYYNSVKDLYSFDKYIIMPNIYAEPTVLYFFDTATEILDSLEIPFFLSRSDEAIFSFKGDFYAISSNNTIYRTKDFPAKDAVWDSVHISKYLYDWKDYEPNSKVADRDIIYSTWADDEQIYFLVQRSTYDYVAGGLEFFFRSNIVKLFKDEPTSVEEVENVESERVYLWSGNPYPTPTKDMVRTKVYWNSVYDINNARIEFYDLYGSKLINPKYTIEHHNIYSADIVWDCSEYRNGIYFMHVSLAGDTKLVKMMIAK
jgi:photosystem II stability/assembly factor-like uncharacterized protein